MTKSVTCHKLDNHHDDNVDVHHNRVLDNAGFQDYLTVHELLPYHANLAWERTRVGLGILGIQKRLRLCTDQML
jgi:hypothetical protein